MQIAADLPVVGAACPFAVEVKLIEPLWTCLPVPQEVAMEIVILHAAGLSNNVNNAIGKTGPLLLWEVGTS